MSPRRVIRGATTLPLDGRRIVRKSDILIEDGKIAAIGGVDTEGAMITDARGVVMPGLVQAHTHLDQALLDQHFVPSVDPIHYERVQIAAWTRDLDAEAVHLQAHASLVRGMHAGVVAFADAGGMRHRMSAIEVASGLGVRLVACLDGTDVDLLRAIEMHEGELDEQGRAFVSLAVWGGSAERTGSRFIQQAGKLAVTHNLPLVLHVGTRPADRGGVERLDRLGVLGPNVVICHAWGQSLSKKGAKLLADANASLVLTPAFDLLMGAPPPALDMLLEAEVNLALGSDTGATRLGFDLFKETRLLYRLLKGRTDQPASKALEIATRGGGRALNVATGSIEVKQHADLILVDIVPEPNEDHESVAKRIVCDTTPRRIRNLWIGGQVALSDGRIAKGDPPAEAAEEALRARLGFAVEQNARLRHLIRNWLHRRKRRALGWHSGQLPFLD